MNIKHLGLIVLIVCTFFLSTQFFYIYRATLVNPIQRQLGLEVTR